MFFLWLECFLLLLTVEMSSAKGAEVDMSFLFAQNLVAPSRRSCKSLLAFLWFVGFACGICVAACTDNLTSLMRACCDAGVSIVGLFLVPFVPFLISAFAVYYSIPLIVYLTGFIKAFFLGFCACAVYTGFVGGGWMICLLLLFTDLLTAPALLWFQLRCLLGKCHDTIRCGGLAVLWFISVSAVDYLWIVPLLRDII